MDELQNSPFQSHPITQTMDELRTRLFPAPILIQTAKVKSAMPDGIQQRSTSLGSRDSYPIVPGAPRNGNPGNPCIPNSMLHHPICIPWDGNRISLGMEIPVIPALPNPHSMAPSAFLGMRTGFPLEWESQESLHSEFHTPWPQVHSS